jgi:hypothetical protein
VSNSEGDDCVKILIKPYIEEKIGAKCELWQVSLERLRAEWALEHKNLIQRFEDSEKAKALAKDSVDRHFETINTLQQRMDKLTVTFVSKEDHIALREEFDRKISDKMKHVWTVVILVLSVLAGAFVAHVAGKI